MLVYNNFYLVFGLINYPAKRNVFTFLTKQLPVLNKELQGFFLKCSVLSVIYFYWPNNMS